MTIYYEFLGKRFLGPISGLTELVAVFYPRVHLYVDSLGSENWRPLNNLFAEPRLVSPLKKRPAH